MTFPSGAFCFQRKSERKEKFVASSKHLGGKCGKESVFHRDLNTLHIILKFTALRSYTITLSAL